MKVSCRIRLLNKLKKKNVHKCRKRQPDSKLGLCVTLLVGKLCGKVLSEVCCKATSGTEKLPGDQEATPAGIQTTTDKGVTRQEITDKWEEWG